MAEYIEREKARTLIENYGIGAIEDGRKILDPVDDIIMLAKGLDLIPSADVVEVVHGEWKREQNRRTCSYCEFVYYDNGGLFNYCPNCGAKMDGRGEENR